MTDSTEIRSFLLRCTIINYGISLLCTVFSTSRDWLHWLHGRWFRLSRENFNAVPLRRYGGI